MSTRRDYQHLEDVLARAYEQASSGKGAQRHGQGQPFEDQPMQQLCKLHGVGFATGQASKKAQEALRLPLDAAVRELLGAINYLAGAVVFLEAQDRLLNPPSAENDNAPSIGDRANGGAND